MCLFVCLFVFSANCEKIRFGLFEFQRWQRKIVRTNRIRIKAGLGEALVVAVVGSGKKEKNKSFSVIVSKVESCNGPSREKGPIRIP